MIKDFVYFQNKIKYKDLYIKKSKNSFSIIINYFEEVYIVGVLNYLNVNEEKKNI